MNIYITVGISGSGKSTYQKKHLPNVKVICQDDIRKELTGDVSDMSQNDKVIGIAYGRLRDYVRNGEDVYWSSTNLTKNAIQKIIKKTLEVAEEFVTFHILILTDSFDEDLCRSRVKADLRKEVDRSKTTKMMNDKETGEPLGYDVIHYQRLQFEGAVKTAIELAENSVNNPRDKYEIILEDV